MKSLLVFTTLVALPLVAGVGAVFMMRSDRAPDGAPAPLPLSVDATRAQLERLTAPIEPPDVYQALTERPVFHADRQLHVPVAVAPEAPRPVAKPELLLVGAMLMPGAGAQAFVRVDGAPQAVVLRVGDPVAGWTVREIEPRQIVLEAGDEEWVLPIVSSNPGGESVPSMSDVSQGTPQRPRTRGSNQR